MNQPLHNTLQWAIRFGILQITILLSSLVSVGWIYAAEEDTKIIEVKLGDYRFMPEEIQLIADQPVVLRLINTDSVTPHNFTMKDQEGVADIDVDVRGGKTVDIQVPPLPAGKYPYYCDKKLIFMKSHQDKGMVGHLIVTTD